MCETPICPNPAGTCQLRQGFLFCDEMLSGLPRTCTEAEAKPGHGRRKALISRISGATRAAHKEEAPSFERLCVSLKLLLRN